jgi:3-methyl-2-oxobutanoate hydroxymethyltransferase
MLVLELIPSALAKEVTGELPIPVIGIGAGPQCSGQVLVLHDMLNLTPGKLPRFVRNFMEGSASVQDAAHRYVAAVKDQSFPDIELHSY